MSYSAEVRGFRDWISNPHRFATQDEAEAFIQQVRARWVPADFVRETKTQETDDPVNARWDPRKKDAVRLTVKDVAAAPKQEAASSSYEAPPVPKPPSLEAFVLRYGTWADVPEEAFVAFNVEMQAWKDTLRHCDRWEDGRLDADQIEQRRQERAEMEAFLDRRRALPGPDERPPARRAASKEATAPLALQGFPPICDDCARQSGRLLSAGCPQNYTVCENCGVLRACHGDAPEQPAEIDMRTAARERAINGDPLPTDWTDREALILRSPSLRRDLQHLIAHGTGRHDLSRQLYDAFKSAYGRAPASMAELVCWLETPLGLIHLRGVDETVLNTLKIFDSRKRRELAKRRTKQRQEAAARAEARKVELKRLDIVLEKTKGRMPNFDARLAEVRKRTRAFLDH